MQRASIKQTQQFSCCYLIGIPTRNQMVPIGQVYERKGRAGHEEGRGKPARFGTTHFDWLTQLPIIRISATSLEKNSVIETQKQGYSAGATEYTPKSTSLLSSVAGASLSEFPLPNLLSSVVGDYLSQYVGAMAIQTYHAAIQGHLLRTGRTKARIAGGFRKHCIA